MPSAGRSRTSAGGREKPRRTWCGPPRFSLDVNARSGQLAVGSSDLWRLVMFLVSLRVSMVRLGARILRTFR